MNSKQTINTSIIEISQTIDSTAKEITMLVHKLNFPNANGLDFLKEYTEKNMKSLINKPVTCKYYEDIDDINDHEYVVDKKTGKIIELNTIAIGTITDVWIDKVNEDEDTEALYAKATIWSYKYPKIMEVIERNFSEDNCTSSVEVEIYSYNEEASPEYRYALDFSYLGNTLLGQHVTQADSDARVLGIFDKEIAQAVKHDLEVNNKNKEDESVSEKFNKGIEIQYHGIEVNSLKLSDVSSKIYNILNPLNPKTNNRQWNYYIRDVFVTHVIAESERDYTELWKIPYTITNDQVVISPQDQWIKGTIGFIPDGVDLDSLQSQVVELNTEIEKLKEEAKLQMSKTVEELQVELATKETEIATFKKSIEDLEVKVAELNQTIVTQETAKKEMEVQITELNTSISELGKYKEQVETAQREATVTELSTKYSKVLPDEVFKSEDVQTAIKELNSQKLDEIVVNELVKQKVSETEVSSKNGDVTITASKQEDLLPKDVVSEYGLTI